MIRTPTKVDTRYDNAPILEFACDQLTLQGYSRAAVQTYWRIPEHKIIIDHGAHPWEFYNSPTMAITHTHADHCNGIVNYIATRHLFRLSIPTIYVPPHTKDTICNVIESWKILNNQKFEYDVQSFAIGDEQKVHANVYLTAFHATHSIETQGYCLVEKTDKLKPELAQLEQKQIDKKRLAGEDITNPQQRRLFAFCGDTSIEVMEKNPWLYEVPILILECTFLSEDERELAGLTKHTHLEDIIERSDLFKNKLLVLSHFSTRYLRDEVLDHLDRMLPKNLKERVIAWI